MFDRSLFELEMQLLRGGLAGPVARELEVEVRGTDAKAQKKIKSWSLLPHQLEVSGKLVPLEPGQLSLPYHDASGKLKTTKKLQDALNAVTATRFEKMSIALVDLTKDLAAPELAHHLGDQMVFAMSIPKIAALLAAFQIRADLRALAASSGAKDSKTLFAAARDAWIATQTPASGSKETPFLGLARKDALLLKRKKPIAMVPKQFTQSRTAEVVGGKVKLGSYKTIKTENFTDKWKIPNLGVMFDVDTSTSPLGVDFTSDYRHHLELAIGESKNSSARASIDAVGFMTIGSVLMQSGLVHPARGGGLWLRSNYGPCIEYKKLLRRNHCVKKRYGAHAFAPFGGSTQYATASSLASFFTLLAQGRLVGAKDSKEMLAMLDKSVSPGNATRSPLTETLDFSVPTKVFSKLGLVSTFSDVVYVERTVGGKTLRYAAAALSGKLEDVTALGEELERIIRDNN